MYLSIKVPIASKNAILNYRNYSIILIALNKFNAMIRLQLKFCNIGLKNSVHFLSLNFFCIDMNIAINTAADELEISHFCISFETFICTSRLLGSYIVSLFKCVCMEGSLLN
jgi:hypothetical protein